MSDTWGIVGAIVLCALWMEFKVGQVIGRLDEILSSLQQVEANTKRELTWAEQHPEDGT